MEDNKFSKINIAFVGFLAVLTIFLVGGFVLMRTKSTKTVLAGAVTPRIVTSNFSSGDYIVNARQILNSYFNERGKFPADPQNVNGWISLVEEARKALLNLRVSTDYKDRHLQMILVLDRIENLLKQKSLVEATNLEENLLNLSKL